MNRRFNLKQKQYGSSNRHQRIWALVSSDLKGNPHSSIFSALETLVIGGNLAKVLAWY